MTETIGYVHREAHSARGQQWAAMRHGSVLGRYGRQADAVACVFDDWRADHPSAVVRKESVTRADRRGYCSVSLRLDRGTE